MKKIIATCLLAFPFIVQATEKNRLDDLYENFKKKAEQFKDSLSFDFDDYEHELNDLIDELDDWIVIDNPSYTPVKIEKSQIPSERDFNKCAKFNNDKHSKDMSACENSQQCQEKAENRYQDNQARCERINIIDKVTNFFRNNFD